MTDKPEFKMPLWMLDQYDVGHSPLLDAMIAHRRAHPELYPIPPPPTRRQRIRRFVRRWSGVARTLRQRLDPDLRWGGEDDDW